MHNLAPIFFASRLVRSQNPLFWGVNAIYTHIYDPDPETDYRRSTREEVVRTIAERCQGETRMTEGRRSYL